MKIIELWVSRTPGYLELFFRSLRVRDNEISLYMLIQITETVNYFSFILSLILNMLLEPLIHNTDI
jgi:hypothetical protein